MPRADPVTMILFAFEFHDRLAPPLLDRWKLYRVCAPRWRHRAPSFPHFEKKARTSPGFSCHWRDETDLQLHLKLQAPASAWKHGGYAEEVEGGLATTDVAQDLVPLVGQVAAIESDIHVVPAIAH